jgi:ABC-type transporter Mla subunit MlaD
MTSVFDQLASLENLASGSLGGAETVAKRLEETQTTLARSVAELAKSQQDLDATVESRRNALLSLVSLIEEKRGDFLGALGSFSGTLEESFRHAESRAQNVGQLLTQATQETAGVVDERFAQIRAATERERERTAETLHAAYEQATQELSQVLNQASERFNSAAAEIRGLSQQVAQDLEATRAELRRGAQELPRETAEQATALRRVISDQVNALNELTEIVGRSGRVYDIAEKSPPRQVQEAPRPQALPAQPAPAPEPAPRSRVAPPPPPPPPQPGAKAPAGQGWLSDVLKRASQDEESERGARRPTAISGGGLGNLSAEIARMVDNTALAETWRRFQRGEREGLFTRHLYTSAGRQAFEEMRRRYRSEPEFRATIDSYVRNFEDLLAEKGRNDPDGEQSLDLLTAEPGKVYTMLAHASGRLG